MFEIKVDNRSSGPGERRARAVQQCWAVASALLLIGSAACSGKEEPDTNLTGGSTGASGGSGNAGAGGGGGIAADSSVPVGQAGTIMIDPIPGNNAGNNQSTSDAGAVYACVNLGCQQTSCTTGDCKHKNACQPGVKTTVRGTVYDPAGKVPLYNVVVYVPNGDVAPLVSGATCDRCESRVLNPVTSALTDTKGEFVLDDVPVGTDIPLVMQVGKWRRIVKIPAVEPCVETVLSDKNLTRLPRNKAEGDIPLIAITTGGADSMECLPRRMGIDDAEFTTETGDGRIHLYRGGDVGNTVATRAFAATLNAGAALTPATTVWADVDHLKAYDLVILSCEGATLAAQKPASARQAMYDYESLGGRVFASHWHHYWFSNGPAPVPSIGTWMDYPDPPATTVGNIDTTFPKGEALADWLVHVGASTTRGQLTITAGRDNVQSVDPMLARQWITVDVPAGMSGGRGGMVVPAHTAIEYLSFNAPVGVPEAQQCGRAVFNDLHVSATGLDRPGQPFPSGCEVRDLTAQEKAVAFLLFDLSSCVQQDERKPEPPPVPPKPIVQ